MSKKPIRIPTEVLEKLRARLEALPPKPKTDHSRQDSVLELQAQIRRAVKELGYSFADIAELYGELGTEISASTIASTLNKLAPNSTDEKSETKTVAKARKKKAKVEDDAGVPDPQPIFTDPQDLALFEALPGEDEELLAHIADTSLGPDLR